MSNASTTTWFHGTEQHINITEWEFSPPSSVYKPELVPHTAVFLTTDKTLAYCAGGKLYSATIHPGANVLDLRIPSKENEELRRIVVQGKYGRV